MVLAMAGFACGDAFIKIASQSLPTGQIVVMIGGIGTLLFALIARLNGVSPFDAGFFAKPVLIRNVAEGFGTICFVTSLSLTELVTVSSIQQAGPLLVTLGAALFLGETVGPRRWAAVILGLIGVLIILRPGSDGVGFGALMAIFAVILLSIRDLATRRSPRNLHTLQLATWGFSSLIPAGLILTATQGGLTAMTLTTSGLIFCAIACTMMAYFSITAATRSGDLSVISPFRYSRLIFALFIGMLILGERPDFWTLVGAVIVIGSGLYVFARERRPPPFQTPRQPYK
jgi:drug/metabolite transporter (DMT)-like permease